MIRRLMFAAALAALFVGGISTGAGGSPTLITRICSTVTRTVTVATTSTVTSISTVISTVTQTVTTSQTLTTGTTTMTPPPPSGFGSKLTALYALEDAAQSDTRVSVSTPAQLASQAGSPTAHEVDVQAGTYPGAYEFSATPTTVVKYVFAPGVKFTGSSVVGRSGTIVAVHITGSRLILWGPADVSNPNWDGVRVEGANSVVIGGGIKTHDNGNQGFLIQRNGSVGSQNVWLDGLESTNNGTAAAAQSDGVGGYYVSGVHGIYWGDGTVGGGIVNSYVHDQPNGYCLQVYQGNAAGNGSIFAYNTFQNCTATGQSGSDTGGLCAYFYDGGSNQTYVANVCNGARFAGLGSHITTGAAQGNVFWNDGQNVYNDSAPNLAVSDSHSLNPQLASLKNLAASYTDYLPRTDFTGAARITADPGAFAVP
jgi:hypothetical protein